ncbi:MAG: RecX family transcriptional regulator, partial [Lachnospiraceae bacterium]
AALCNKGVNKELIEQALEACYSEEGEEAAIAAILRKKKFCPETADREQKQKMYGYLTRKGFRYENIRQVIQVYDGNA